MKPLLTLLLAAATAASLRADDTIKLTDGTRLTGHATAYDATTKIVHFRTSDGNDLEIRLAQLDGRSAYQVARSRVDKDDGPGQLQLANFTRDVQLYAHAVRHYGWAEKADPSLKPQVEEQMAILRQSAAAWGMEMARAAIAKNDVREAEKWLTKIIQKLPDEPQATEARAMLDEYYNQVHAARDDELERKNAELIQRELSDAKRFYDRMIERNKAGLTNTGSGGRAVNEWENAISDGQRALRELDRFAKRHKDVLDSETIAGYRQLVNDQLIEIYINMASHWTTRSSYNKALREVNHALAIDSTNKDALATRARIEQASSRGWGW